MAPRKGSTHHKPLTVHGFLVGYPTTTACHINANQITAASLLPSLFDAQRFISTQRGPFWGPTNHDFMA